MAERPNFVPIEQLEARHQKVSGIITSREQKITGLPPRPDNPLELMSWKRREHVSNVLQRSIDQRLKPEVEHLELQIAEQLVPTAREYEEKLLKAQRDLKRIELRVASGRMESSPEELEQFRAAVREVEERPLSDSLLAKALELIRQPTQPTTSEVVAAVAPTPIEGGVQPKEEISEEEKQRREKLVETLNSFTNLTVTERKILEAGILYSEQNRGFDKKWAREVYGNDIPLRMATKRLSASRKNALTKVEAKIEMVTILPDGKNRESTHYFRLKEWFRQQKDAQQEPAEESKVVLPKTPEHPKLTKLDRLILEGVWETFEDPKKALDPDELVEKIWGDKIRKGEDTESAALNRFSVYLSQLRNKLKELPELNLEVSSIKPQKGVDPKGTKNKYFIKSIRLEENLQEEVEKPLFRISFPSGEVRETDDELIAKAAEMILRGQSQHSELNMALFGEDNEVATDLLKELMSNKVQPFLESAGLTIKIKEDDIKAPDISIPSEEALAEITRLEEEITKLETYRPIINASLNLPGWADQEQRLNSDIASKQIRLKELRGEETK